MMKKFLILSMIALMVNSVQAESIALTNKTDVPLMIQPRWGALSVENHNIYYFDGDRIEVGAGRSHTFAPGDNTMAMLTGLYVTDGDDNYVTVANADVYCTEAGTRLGKSAYGVQLTCPNVRTPNGILRGSLRRTTSQEKNNGIYYDDFVVEVSK